MYPVITDNINQSYEQTLNDLFSPFSPFQWQMALLNEIQAEMPPDSLELPTATGKTSGVLRIWLTSFLHQSLKTPRRLVYVINRRAVADQVYDDALKMLDSMKKRWPTMDDSLYPKVYAFRGQRTIDAAWGHSPAHPAIIIGTVDMLGSRLLFDGYGCGKWQKAQSAGMLGQDCWWILDEPHLVEPFSKLLTNIKKINKNPYRPFWITQMGATNRKNAVSEGVRAFSLIKYDDERLNKRLRAKKIVECMDEIYDQKLWLKEVEKTVKSLMQESKPVIGIIVSTVREAAKLYDLLYDWSKKANPHTPFFSLTGSMRGRDRDQLLQTDDFRNVFLSNGSSRQNGGILIGTHALEAGFDGDFDILITDLPSIPSLIQRLGRLNRLGNSSNAKALIFPLKDGFYTQKAHEWLKDSFPNPQNGKGIILSGSYDSTDNYSSLLDEWEKLPTDKQSLLSITPVYSPELSKDIITIMSALTSGTRHHNFRTDILLHGYEKPIDSDIQFVWREEVRWFNEANQIVKALELRSLIAAESARLSFTAGKEFLNSLKNNLIKSGQSELLSKIWMIDQSQKTVEPVFYKKNDQWFINKDGKSLPNATVILPPQAGGYNGTFMNSYCKDPVPDIRDECCQDDLVTCPMCWNGTRFKATRETDHITPPLEDSVDDLDGWILIDDDFFHNTGWAVFRRSLRTGSPRKLQSVLLSDHSLAVKEELSQLCDLLGIPPELKIQLEEAAYKHDCGKDSPAFQAFLGNRAGDVPLAKSNRLMRGISPFRHEVLSVLKNPNLTQLVRHLILAHHGYGRPDFPPDRLPPHLNEEDFWRSGGESSLRFSTLTREWGAWTLAWLESLIRAADAVTSKQEVDSL